MKKMLLAIIVASGVAFTLFAKLDLIPMPREIAMTDGVCTNAAAPKVERVDGIPAEGYELSVRPDGVTIRASDAAGEFYARQTLVQLADSASASVPCCEIRDSPRFKWRGVHLDDVRHFMGKETVKRTIDEIAKCKFNVFHWHLTDDQSWRIDVPGYPELLDYGDQYLADEGQLRFPDGPRAARRYYTKDDIREIADYAALRHVKIVPEIDFPGHFYAVACAYPEFVCNPGNVEAQGRWPMVTGFKEGCDPMCVGNPDAVKFILAALDAVCDLFPDSDVVHIGGDECRFGYWKDCPKCRALMEREGMCDPRELQAWLTRRVVGHLAERGRRAIGWDEMLDAKDGALPASTMGMRWHPKGAERTARAAANGHEIVNCNNRFCYFDYSQGLDGDAHRYLGKRKVALETVYSFDPLAEFPEKAKGRVIGGQCNNWTEFTFNGNDLEWKLWPRTCALAEVLWTGEKRPGFADFKRRMAAHRRRLLLMGVNCAPLE